MSGLKLMTVILILTFSNAKAESFGECLVRAGQFHGVNPKLLYAIAVVESGLNVKAINFNKNGSKDYGIFQINESNLVRLGIPVEYAFDPCKSAYIAGYLLKKCVSTYGYSWHAIDCYNKGSKARGFTDYVKKVLFVYKRLSN